MKVSTTFFRWFTTGLFALGLMLAYHVAIVVGLVSYGNSHGVGTSNFTRAERFAYYESPPEPYPLLVGSSMTGCLRADYFEEPSVNLAMDAGCSATGLELIRRVEWPRKAVVFVEVNGTITRGIDSEMLGKLFEEPWFSIRHVFPEFRVEYRPSMVLLKTLRDWRLSSRTEQERDRQQNQNSELRKRAIDKQVAAASQELGREKKALLEVASDKIEEQISALQRRGLRVVLFRVPNDAALETLLSVRREREFFARRFPSERFEWLPECREVAWETSDGVHLVKRHARIFARHMERCIALRNRPVRGAAPADPTIR